MSVQNTLTTVPQLLKENMLADFSRENDYRCINMCARYTNPDDYDACVAGSAPPRDGDNSGLQYVTHRGSIQAFGAGRDCGSSYSLRGMGIY